MTSDGIERLDVDGRRTRVRWSDVVGVRTFKYDNFSTDEIVLTVEVRDHPGEWIELSEESKGFGAASAAIEAALGIDPAWHATVAKPPFARNERVLYRREDSSLPVEEHGP